MTATTRRQSILLATLLVILAGVLWYRLGDVTPTAASAPAVRGGRAATAGAPTSVPDVHLAQLDESVPVLDASTRNPFRFRQRPAPPPPVATASGPRPGAPQAVVNSGPPPPPPIPLRFIGLVEPQAGSPRIAVFASTDGRGDVLYGKEGDIIEGRYRVLRVGTESADLASVDGRGRQTLRLSGQ